MKKVLSLLLAVCVCLTLGACSKNEGDDPATEPTEPSAQNSPFALPLGLSFGMSYDDAKAAYALLPAISPSNANDGYFGSGEVTDDETKAELATFLGFSEETKAATIWFPFQGFSFNESQKLYEFYLTFTLLTEGDAEQALNETAAVFDEKCGKQAVVTEGDSSLSCVWDTDGLGVTLSIEQNTDATWHLTLIMHHKGYQVSD